MIPETKAIGHKEANAGLEALAQAGRGIKVPTMIGAEVAEYGKKEANAGRWIGGGAMKSHVTGIMRSGHFLGESIGSSAAPGKARIFYNLGLAIYGRIQEIGGIIRPFRFNYLQIPLTAKGIIGGKGKVWRVDFVRTTKPVKIPARYHLANAIHYVLIGEGRKALNALMGKTFAEKFRIGSNNIGVWRKEGGAK